MSIAQEKMHFSIVSDQNIYSVEDIVIISMLLSSVLLLINLGFPGSMLAVLNHIPTSYFSACCICWYPARHL